MNMDTLINIILLAVVAWFLYMRLGPTKGLRTLRAADFQREVEGSKNKMLIDVREPNEFKGGYIAGAKNIPLSQLGQRYAEIPKDKDIFLYCRSGMRSKAAARILRKNGHTRLAHLQGGIGAWRGKISK